ncbi:MAG: DUF1257 domain-containing protein [Planctomycetes bacterium]|nr:DUF1257 domain-containing protein [Planctomycetota bacterium]
MSAFTTLQTEFVSAEHLRRALTDVGFAKVEVHNTPQPLVGFMGDRRSQSAEIIIRRSHVGGFSNDIGFKRDQNGRFVALISDYDRQQYDAPWLRRLTQRYAYHVAKDTLERQEFEIVEETTQADQTIHLTVRRMV